MPDALPDDAYAEHDRGRPPSWPDDGVLLEARADMAPLLVALGGALVSIAALVLSVIAIMR